MRPYGPLLSYVKGSYSTTNVQVKRGDRGSLEPHWIWCWLLGLILGVVPASGQDLSGYWQGVEHDTNAYSHPYPTSLTLTQSGTHLSGFYYQSEPLQTQYNVLFAIEKGQLSANEGSFEINTPIRENAPAAGSTVCTGLITFTYNPDRERILARTHYRQAECPASQIELYRPKLKAKNPFCSTDEKELYVYGFDTHWYADAQRQVLLHRGNAYKPILDSTTTFYITQTIIGLETPAVPLVINVAQVTIANPASINVVCATGTAQLLVEARGKSPLQYRLNGATYQPSAAFELAKPGSYSLTVEDSLGCQASQQIELIDDCHEGLYLPSAFSPNGDGVNDELAIWFPFQSLRVEEFLVYNRWGILIYRSEPTTTIESGQALWSTQLNGQSLLPDRYTYQLRVTTPAGKQLSVQGNLSVLK